MANNSIIMIIIITQELSPLVPALQIGYYELTWEKCADLPAPLYGASVALHDNKVYVMADAAPDNSTYNYVYTYDINSNQWDRLPPPRQYMGRLLVIDNRITVLGGRDSATKQRTNKVKTFSNDKWINFYPNMLKARFKPGVTIHSKYVIVAGGILNNDTFSDNIEIFNWRENSQWILARMKLPKPMWAPVLTISDDLLHIVGYSSMNGNSRKVYRVPAHMITSSAAQLTSNETDLWAELPPAPHGSTAVISNSCPPVIIGGRDEQGVPTADITVLDVPNNPWKKIASLTTARVSTAVVSINEDSILVIGGYSGGHDAEEVLKNSITTVEKGTIKLCHTQ